MPLEEKIHTFWRENMSLASAVSADRLLTGPADGVSLPHVVLVHEKTDVLLHTNRAAPWKKTVLRFDLHHADFERGRAIAQLIERIFDRLRLADDQNAWTCRFRLLGGEDRPRGDCAWTFVRRFELTG